MIDFSKFEKKVNVNFKDKNLLKQAFIHRSYLNENPKVGIHHNERLEFLGDAVLELITTNYLYKNYPDKNEGDLTSYRAALVNAVTLSMVSEKLGMNEFLLLSKGESKDTGKARQDILANTFESFLGALYLDQGYEKSNDFVEELYDNAGKVYDNQYSRAILTTLNNKYLKNILEQAAKKQSKGVIKLAARAEFNFILMQSNELLTKNHEHPKLNEANKIIKREIELNPSAKIIIFTQFRDTAEILSKNLNELAGINAEVFIGQASKAGKKGLNQKEQKKIIQEFSEGKINILCATCIGEEGLDIPEVNAVIFYEPVASAIRTIQRSGRTARLNKGKIIMLITKKTRDESSFYISKIRERKMKKAIEEVRNSLTKTFEIQKKIV